MQTRNKLCINGLYHLLVGLHIFVPESFHVVVRAYCARLI